MAIGGYRFRRSFGNVSSRFRGARPDTYPLFTGILDDYPGAAAAYSLRALSAAWLAGDVVEVRRSSDSTTQGFTASQITSGAMLNFVNGGTTDLYNSARYFNGTSTTVTLGSTVSMVGDFSITLSHLYIGTGATSDLLGDNTINSRFGYSTTASAYFLSTTSGSVTFTGAMPIENDINAIAINRVGTTVTLTLNGDDYTGTLGGTLNINRISSFAGVNYSKGFTYAINLNGQAAYTGLGTSVTAWEDTIGSNDGTETNGAAYTGQPFDGFVSTWYDQSGNGNDATQATTTAQPKIVSAGALVTGGLDFDGVDDWMSGTGVTGDISVFATCKQNAQGADFSGIVGVWDGLPNQRSWLLSDDETTSCAFLGSTAGTATSAGVNGAGIITSQSLLSAITSSSVFELWRNGASEGTSTGITTFSSSAALTIGAYNAGQASTAFTGTIAEIIVYNSDQSANRAGIETNINDHYSIY